MIHIHDWLVQNAYYVPDTHCGQARICLKCGKIELNGNVRLPEEFMRYKYNILDGKKWWE